MRHHILGGIKWVLLSASQGAKHCKTAIYYGSRTSNVDRSATITKRKVGKGWGAVNRAAPHAAACAAHHRPPPPPNGANWRLDANYGMHRHRPWQTCPKQIGALLGGEEAFRSSLAPAYSAATRRRRGASATIQHTKPMQAPLAALQPAIASRLTYGPLESSMQHLCSSHRLRLSAAEQQRRRPPGPPPGYPAAAALVPPELVRSRCTSQSFRTPVRRSKRPGREFVLARALAWPSSGRECLRKTQQPSK